MEDENQNLKVPIPGEKQYKKPKVALIALGIVLLLIIAGFGAYFYFTINKKKVVPPSQTQQTSLQPRTTSQLTQILLSQSPIDFPEVSSSSPVASSTIPALLSKLIAPDAKNLQTFQALFSNQKTGFSLTYNIPQNLQGAFTELFKLLLSPDWKLMEANTTNKVGVLVADNTGWQARTVETYVDASNTAVSFIAIKK